MKLLKKGVRLILAGITAFFLLTCFCQVYTRWPVHLPNPRNNTDYVWQPGYRWMLMTEGISWGRIDEAGYNNPSVVDAPDVLILGSSHMEAKNVLQSQNTASQLQQLLGPQLSVYNMGISGHYFAKVCQYLPDNLSLYETPPRYVILETDSLQLTEQDVEDILNHTVEFTPSYTEGIVAQLQKNPFIRQAFHCLKTGWLSLLLPERPSSGPLLQVVHPAPPVPQSQAPLPSREPYDRLFAHLDALQQKYGTQLIIFLHPWAEIKPDGTILFSLPPEQELFAESCREHHILYVNMQDAFTELAAREHKLPHGFITGQPGVGHLNQDGHRVIAGELARVITELEKEGR